jgi:transcription factor SFP1
MEWIKSTPLWATTFPSDSTTVLPDVDSNRIKTRHNSVDSSSFIDAAASSSSSTTASPSPQPLTPPSYPGDITMPSTSPIDIATPTRNSSSSPSSQGTTTATNNNNKTANYLGLKDSRTSAMMTSGGLEPGGMGRGRQDSFAGAKPISMNNPNRRVDDRPRRESLAGSLVGGMSWGGVSVGSWIRDE